MTVKKVLVVLAMLVALSAGVVASVAPERYEVRSRHYLVTTDLPRDEVREAAAHMDEVFRAYSAMFSNFPARTTKPVTLYLLADRESYVRTLREVAGFDATNSGGVFFATNAEAGVATWIRGRSRERAFYVLRHEGFHQFAHVHIGGSFPIWANEGLAEYFGSAIPVRGKLRTGLVPSSRLERVKRAIRNGETLEFDTFIRLDGRTWSDRVLGGDARTWMMYDQAWSIAHFLVHGDNGRYTQAFERFIRETSRGVDIGNAINTAFGTRDLSAFERAWKRWTLELEPDALSTATERLVFLGDGLASLHEQGVSVASMDELKNELRARGFTVKRWSHGIGTEQSAEQDELFEAPPSGRRGRETAFVLEPSEEEGLPPTIGVEGLDVKIELLWRIEDERAVHDVVYR
jgi:hypothetical protein